MWRISLVFLICLAAVPSYSNPPSPAPPKNSENQKTHPAAADEKPAYNPAGTDKQPFVVKSLEAEKTPERTEQERPEREEKAANERSLIIWTIVLACSTIALALIAGGQLWMFKRQLGLMHKSMKTAEDATEAARRSAEIAEKGLRLTERPQFNISGWGIANFTAGKASEIRFLLGNTGRSEAELIKCSIGWRISTGDPGQCFLSPMEIAGVVYPNTSIDIVVPLSVITEAEFQSLWAAQSFIFLYGELSCTDTFDWTCVISIGARVTLRKGVVTADFIKRHGVNQIRWYPPDKNGI